MKKTVSILLTAIMVLSMLTVFVGAETKTPDYASAKDGDVLYTVDFSGTDGIYAPANFRNGNAKMAATTVEVKDNGKTIVATTPADAGSAWFYGSPIKGLKLGTDKKYTITCKAAFPTGNAGIYFNMADLTADQAVAYNAMYGIYGQIKTGNCMTMSFGAGGKFTAEKVSLADSYTPIPTGVENDKDGFVNVTIKIDGLFYSVWFNDQLYDQSYITDSVLNVCPNLAFAIYLYNKTATFTVKDVVVKKGCDYAQSNSVFAKTTELKYDNFKFGQKITDINFAAKSGAYVPYFNQNAKPASVTIETENNGNGIILKTDATTDGNAHWYGSDIGNLKITDSTKYTFVYKEKDSGKGYAGAVALNGVRFALNTVNRYNWYGVFTNSTGYKTNPYVKFAYNGSNFTNYGYTDANMAAFNAIKPTVDADGYTEIVTELKGWTWTIYMHDDNQNGKLVAVQTVDVKKLAEEQNHPIANGDNLAFNIYIYNKDVTFAIKDAAVYKGLTVSETYNDNPGTGDSMVWVAFVAIVSVLGMGIAVKAKNN